MSTEIYNNFNLRQASPLDTRLTPVATVGALPDLSDPLNFMFESATIYVTGERCNYQARENQAAPGTLIWEKTCEDALVVGAVNYLSTQTTLDLSQVVPDIEDCYAVVVTIVGGTSATVNSIINYPDNKELIIYVAQGQQLTLKHTDYDLAGANDIVLELGCDMTLNGRVIANEYLITVKNSNTIVQKGATQFVKCSALGSIVGPAGKDGKDGKDGVVAPLGKI